jgi:type II secretory pathway component PulF
MPQKQKQQPKKSVLDLNISIGGVNAEQRAILARHLSVMLKSGLTIVEAIEITSEQTSGKLKRVLRGVLKALRAGQSLSDSMARYPKVFSEMFVNIIQAGEKSGNLEENLTNLAEQLEKERELRSKVKGAMLYPTVVLVAALGLGLAMAFLVLPKITPLFEGLKMELPFTTRWLISFSHIIRENTWELFGGITGVIVFILWLIKRKFSQPVTHWLLLKLPLVGKIVYQTNLARFCRSLGTLLKSGLNIDEAIEITSKTVTNYHYKKALTQVSSTVRKGTRLSSKLEQYPKLFPKLTTRMIRVGEKSGKLEESLLFLAHFYEVEVDNTTKSLSTAIEPILLIVIGLVVAFLALSIITPIYKITGNVRR